MPTREGTIASSIVLVPTASRRWTGPTDRSDRLPQSPKTPSHRMAGDLLQGLTDV